MREYLLDYKRFTTFAHKLNTRKIELNRNQTFINSFMNRIETRAAGTKAAYICPIIACFSVEFLLCAGSSFDGGHHDASGGGSLDEHGDTSGGAGVADFGGTWTEEPEEP